MSTTRRCPPLPSERQGVGTYQSQRLDENTPACHAEVIAETADELAEVFGYDD